MTATTDLEGLWYSHSNRIHAYIARHVYETDAVDDLVSSVYLRALVAIRNGNGYVTSATGWLWQITRSVIVDYFRARKRVTFVGLDDFDDIADARLRVFGGFVHALLMEQVRGAVAKLPEAQAMVTTWRLCDYDLGEIAEGMGLTYGAVKAIQVRAYSNLRQRLGEAA